MNQVNEQAIRLPVQQPEATEDLSEEDSMMGLFRIEQEGREHGLPPALIKALSDSFSYAMRLRSGETIAFESATLDDTGLWVTLTLGTNEGDGMFPNAQRFSFDRGVDVRVSDIVWVADAPHGS